MYSDANRHKQKLKLLLIHILNILKISSNSLWKNGDFEKYLTVNVV